MPLDKDKLKARREKLGLTQQQVADAAKMPQQAYARFESGERDDPRLSTMERIAAVLKTTVDALRSPAAPRRKPKP